MQALLQCYRQDPNRPIFSIVYEVFNSIHSGIYYEYKGRTDFSDRTIFTVDEVSERLDLYLRGQTEKKLLDIDRHLLGSTKAVSSKMADQERFDQLMEIYIKNKLLFPTYYETPIISMNNQATSWSQSRPLIAIALNKESFSCHRIHPQILVSSCPAKQEWDSHVKPFLQEEKVMHVYCFADQGLAYLLDEENRCLKGSVAITVEEEIRFHQMSMRDGTFFLDEDPDSSKLMAILVNEACLIKTRPANKLLVHCNSGIGRAGTFSFILNCLLNDELRKNLAKINQENLDEVQAVYEQIKDILSNQRCIRFAVYDRGQFERALNLLPELADRVQEKLDNIIRLDRPDSKKNPLDFMNRLPHLIESTAGLIKKEKEQVVSYNTVLAMLRAGNERNDSAVKIKLAELFFEGNVEFVIDLLNSSPFTQQFSEEKRKQVQVVIEAYFRYRTGQGYQESDITRESFYEIFDTLFFAVEEKKYLRRAADGFFKENFFLVSQLK